MQPVLSKLLQYDIHSYEKVLDRVFYDMHTSTSSLDTSNDAITQRLNIPHERVYRIIERSARRHAFCGRPELYMDLLRLDAEEGEGVQGLKIVL